MMGAPPAVIALPLGPYEMKRKILLLSLLSLLQFVLVHFVLIQQFPNSGDEQAYLYEAQLFSHGQLYAEDPIYDRAHPLNKFVAAGCDGRYRWPPLLEIRSGLARVAFAWRPAAD
jgi:hypothetical protein